MKKIARQKIKQLQFHAGPAQPSSGEGSPYYKTAFEPFLMSLVKIEKNIGEEIFFSLECLISIKHIFS